MKKTPIGQILAEICKEKNLSAIQVAELLGKTRQQVYSDFRIVSMKDDNIEKYAKALNVSKEEIYERWNTPFGESHSDAKDLLAEQIAKIEQLFAQQLAIKDKQIEGLQRTVDVLLGKSECVTETTGKVIDMVTYEVGLIA